MANFEWQTEEEETVWADPAGPTAVATLRQRIPTQAVLGVTALLLLLGGVVYWQINRRVQTAAAAVAAELRATHALISHVADVGDKELFSALISGRDPNWASAQMNLVKEQALFARQPFGFAYQPSDPAKVQMTLSPNLAAAELVFPITYTLPGLAQPMEPIVLQQTAVYRLGTGQRWLLAPPEAEFWGGWQVENGRFLSLTFPQRDGDLARRLLADLDGQVEQLCDQLAELDCPPTLLIRVRLDTSPASFAEINSRQTRLSRRLQLNLPTPTLVGLPLDEAGYDRLMRGYAAQVLTAVITTQVNYRCCQQMLFFSALVDWQLSQLGVRPSPLTPAVYDQILLAPIDPQQIWRFWLGIETADEADWPLVYAYMAFILSQITPEADLVAWERQIESGQLGELIGRNQLAGAWADEWVRFMYQQSASAQIAAAEVPLPTANALYECNTIAQTVVEGFNFRSATWELASAVDAPDNGYSYIENQLTPLPDGSGFLVEQQENNVDALLGHLLLQRYGQQFMVLTAQTDALTNFPGFYFTGQSDPSARYLLLASRGNSHQARKHLLLDLENCRANRCHVPVVPGWATWSPNGRQTLLMGDAPALAPGVNMALREWQRPLTLGNRTAEPVGPVGVGKRPFWLDDTHYSYIRAVENNDGSPELQLVRAAVGRDEVELWLRPADLLALLPEEGRPTELFIQQAQRHPARSDLIWLWATDSVMADGAHFFFLFQPTARRELADTAVASPRLELLYQAADPVQFVLSPNGRWLAVAHSAFVDLVNTETLATKRVSALNMSWSPDGRWLLRQFPTYTLAYAPENDYQYLLTPPLNNCRQIGWSG